MGVEYSKDDFSLARYVAYTTLRVYGEILAERAVPMAFQCLEIARAKRLEKQIKGQNLSPLDRAGKEEAVDESLREQVTGEEAKTGLEAALAQMEKQLEQKLRAGGPEPED